MSYKFYENHYTPYQLPDIYYMPKNHSEYSEKQLRCSDQNSALPEHNSDLQNATPSLRTQLRASERNSEPQKATPSFRTKLRTPGTQLRASERNSGLQECNSEPQNTTPNPQEHSSDFQNITPNFWNATPEFHQKTPCITPNPLNNSDFLMVLTPTVKIPL